MARNRDRKGSKQGKLPAAVPSQRELERNQVKSWTRVGALLEKIRISELRSPDYGKDWQVLDALMEIVAYDSVLRTTSGLVEQQKIFMKARR